MTKKNLSAFGLFIISFMTIAVTANARPTLPADAAAFTDIQISSDDAGGMTGAYLVVHKDGVIEYFPERSNKPMKTQISPKPAIVFQEFYESIAPRLLDAADIAAAKVHQDGLQQLGFRVVKEDMNYRAVCLVTTPGQCTPYYLPVGKADAYTKLYETFTKSAPTDIPCKLLTCF